LTDENSSVQLSQAKMSELKIFKGDCIFIKGKKRKETLVVALIDNKLE
jgi:transitional endoplasmic reticulum ATPase